MGRSFAALTLLAALAACGVDGPPIREGAAPPEVVTSEVEDATTEPDRPRGTLFGGGSRCVTLECAEKAGL